ncbi:MAG: winged helix DNA-binding domain-containing protein [Anaerolineaceae bacterium]|nr:winged helix DNA-binding domain-containing protein [Anaerolineaceae bacterium]MBN2677911.1 winged helix DNA-binding domain-containing protein [Anaerolineaceae bacterium]
MASLSQTTLLNYRKNTFHLAAHARLKSPDQVIRFINERGFIFFWPVKGVELPSLWTATAGSRPVAGAHDDPGHVTWGWKDGLLGSHRCYYAKVLKRRGTFISNKLLPCFFALSENYGSPEEDYLIQYQEGRLTQEARQVFEALLDQGPLDTIALRKAARLSSPNCESRFNKALDQLMADFKILPIGTTDSGGWHYAFLYDTVFHHYPRLSDQARPIEQEDARIEILTAYFASLGAAGRNDIQRLFRWKTDQVTATLDALVTSGKLKADIEITGLCDRYYVIRQLL